MKLIKSVSLTAGLALACSLALAQSSSAPVPNEINGQKVLVFVQQDPPGTRCNTSLRS